MGKSFTRSARDIVSRAARWVLPNGVVTWARERRLPSRQLWSGVYARYVDVPAQGAAYESDAWILPRAQATATLKQAVDRGSPIASELRYLLLPACAAMLTEPGRELSILDFGGAMGVGYLHFRASWASGAYHYHVVDNRRSCEEGRRIFAKDLSVSFHESFDEIERVDIVFMSGVLQYIADYQGVLRALIGRFSPRVLILTLTPVGEFQTFASAQVNLPGSAMAAWFFGRSELKALFAELGYCEVMHTPAELTFDMSNFPSAQRIETMSNLVFAVHEPGA